MLVQHNVTKRELEMFWIEVAAFVAPEVEDILKRCTKDSDEGYKWEDADDKYYFRCRVVATEKHHIRIVGKLICKGYLHKYEYSTV